MRREHTVWPGFEERKWLQVHGAHPSTLGRMTGLLWLGPHVWWLECSQHAFFWGWKMLFLPSKAGRCWKNDKSNEKLGLKLFCLHCPQMPHAGFNGVFWGGPVYKGLLTPRPVYRLLILQKFTILFQESGLQSGEWIWRGRFTTSLIVRVLTWAKIGSELFFFIPSEALLNHRWFVGVTAGVGDAASRSRDTNPCLLWCHHLTLVGGGPTDHKQAGLASYLSDMVTTHPNNSAGAARGTWFCQDRPWISNWPGCQGFKRGRPTKDKLM